MKETTEERIKNLERALLESHVALAAIINKYGGSIEIGYRDFYSLSRDMEYKFVKHEDYQNDTVEISLKKV